MNHKSSFFVAATKHSVALLLALIFSPMLVKADVSLLLHEAIVGINGEAGAAGHVSIYFSNICADSPIKLRLCHPGEQGVVITTYPNFGTDKPYEWVAAPLLPFLYGVEDERNIPLYTNGKIRTMLRETYRQRYLRGIVPDRADGMPPEGHWKDLLVNTFNRDLYCYTLTTTVEEDASLLEKLDRQPNENHFNGMYNNCADFAREILNTYFPHATHRDPFNDLTMTTPKAIAKTLTRYASKRPERLFYVTKYAQLAGPIRRSLDNRHYSEHGLFSKKYLIPMLVFNHIPITYFATVYFTMGYFSVNGKYIEYATPEIAQLNLAARQLKEPGRGKEPTDAGIRGDFAKTAEATLRAGLREMEGKKEVERRRIFGTKQGWSTYKTEFAPLLQKAITDGLFADNKEVKTFFKDLELQSEPSFDEQGALMLKVRAYGEDQILGLTRDNILSSTSDPQLAYKLMIAKVNATLKAREKNRDSLETFAADWDLMKRLSASSPPTSQITQSRPKRFLETPEKTTFGHKVKMTFVLITH
ncbi:MAG: hypothetical protein M3X11_26235 [Acidobacteriota bacterium]|nr:hypothetical protein [Acidobacteriota bacterium]